jgi:hypothetical protein
VLLRGHYPRPTSFNPVPRDDMKVICSDSADVTDGFARKRPRRPPPICRNALIRLPNLPEETDPASAAAATPI